MAAPQPSFTPEFASAFRDMYVGILENELATTKRVIGNIPEDKKSYTPHKDSRTAWQIAVHVAQSDVWFLNSLAEQKFDWTDQPEPATTVAGLNEWYDKNFRTGAARVRKMSGPELLKTVDFFGIMKAPLFLYLNFALVHAVHHRGQLSTYLRPMGAKVPDIYGGSFDEPFTGQ